ncbi:MAG: hypothetical protein FD123_569 [Bacteroidetes bacterium]|nr:MAG: hypothetical protein FD123_569 [Bacteroidota bacterium]
MENAKTKANVHVVQVSITHAVTGEKKSVLTNYYGKYFFEDLEPGIYAVQTYHGNYYDTLLLNVAVLADSATKMKIKIRAREVPVVVVNVSLHPPDNLYEITYDDEGPDLPFYSGTWWTEENISTAGYDLLAFQHLLVNPGKVKRLEISIPPHGKIPPEIAQFTQLERLRISFYGSPVLTDELWKLSRLKKLNIHSDMPLTVPPGIKELQQLEELIFSCKELQPLPDEFAQLKSIRILSLNSCGLTAVPPPIAGLTRLRWLSMNGNKLKTVPAFLTGLTELRSLGLSYNELPEIPAEISRLIKLEELYLENNRLITLPPEIGQLTSLRQLTLEKNQLTVLPESFGKLEKLTSLQLEQNRLRELPASVGQMTALTFIFASGNNLASLPREVGMLTQLTEVDLKNNKITVLPVEIGNWRKLEQLTLSGNRLITLPASVGQLDSLTRLFLLGNPLRQLPAEITGLKKLECLELEKLGLLQLPDTTWNFINKFGYIISGVPDSIAGKPVSYYLKHPDIDPFSKKFVQGKLSFTGDSVTKIVLNKISQANRDVLPFYFFIMHTCMQEDHSPGRDPDFIFYAYHQLREAAAHFVLTRPCTFCAAIKSKEYAEFYDLWRSFITCSMGAYTENADQQIKAGYARLKKNCGSKYAEEYEELIREIFCSGKG